MPKVLTKLRIDEVSAVDRGAGEGVHVRLIKAKKPPFGGKQAKPFGAKDENDGDADDEPVGKVGPGHAKPKGGKNPNLRTNDDVSGGYGGEADGGGDGYDGSSDVDDDINKLAPYWKRDFTSEQRRTMAHNGQAMPGGGYPIGNRKDVKNAVRAIGRAKKPNKTKEHIMSRARSLGCTDCIPDKWMMKSIVKTAQAIVIDIQKDDDESAQTFANIINDMQSTDNIEGLWTKIHDAGHALKESLESIGDDDECVDKSAAVKETVKQYVDHVTALVPSDVAKQWKEREMKKVALQTSVPANDKMNRSAEIRGKGKTVTIESEGDGGEQVDDKDNKEIGATAGTNDKSSFKNKVWKGRFEALLGLEKSQVDYLLHPDNMMGVGEVKDFVDLSKADRARFIEENPIGKYTEKRMADFPEPLRKQLEAGQRAADALAKRDEAETLAAFTKRAGDNGLRGDGVAEALVKLSKADGESLEVFLKAIETMTRAVKAQNTAAVIFKEFGTAKGADVSGLSAYDQLMAKAENYQGEMEKVGKNITIEQAYAHICEKRENGELFQMAKREGSLAA